MQGQSTGLDPGVCMQAQGPDEFAKGEINNHLLKYMMASTALCQQVSHLALTTDDSNFGGFNRKLTAMVFPSNIGIWLAPQAFKEHKNNTPNQNRKIFYEHREKNSTNHSTRHNKNYTKHPEHHKHLVFLHLRVEKGGSTKPGEKVLRTQKRGH